MPLEFSDQRLDQATEQGELVSRAMNRMCCHACGDSGGMQAYDEAATRTLPAEQQTGYYKYVSEMAPTTIYRPCAVCRRADMAYISVWYEEWTP